MNTYIFFFTLFLVSFINKPDLGVPNPIVEEKVDTYSALSLSQIGLSNEVFQLALAGHNRLEAAGQLENPGFLTIVDFSQTSKNKRLYVIDLVEQKVLFNTVVAHGKNTGDEFASNFSNEIGTLKSSLGFYITKNHIMGAKVGFSLIIEGLEKGFNDNAVSRQIIMHGANYATEDFIKKNGRLGRSFGCPALPPELIKPVVETIENGSCLFIYYLDPVYLSKSSLLN